MTARTEPQRTFEAAHTRKPAVNETAFSADEELSNLEESFKSMYQHIDTLRKIADGKHLDAAPEQISGQLSPFVQLLNSETALRELRRWQEIFAPVFAGLDLFNMQLGEGAEFTFRELALSNDSARLALSAIVQRLGTLQARTAA